MYRLLALSKISFNIHTDKSFDCVGNIRLFEATGVGSCLLTDRGLNMADLFKEGHEVMTYSSIKECIEKAKYLLKNDKERLEIASCGQKRTLRDHTVKKRCEAIDEMIQDLL
jgi:spore maturation protein CgeB